MSSNYLKSANVTRKDLRKNSKTFLPARVIDVILDENHPDFKNAGEWDAIGAIKWKPLYQTRTEESTESLPLAYPLRSHIKQLPLKNEIVLLVAGPSKKIDLSAQSSIIYYTDVVSIWNHPHSNEFPENTSIEPDLGEDFVQRSDINPLLPYTGDVILEGRHGQSLRFSSTLPGRTPWTGSLNNDPIILLTNGQQTTSNSYSFITENINRDPASIYLTSTQKINIQAASTDYKSYQNYIPATPNTYTGNQVVINSGRLVFNSNQDHIILSSNLTISFNAIRGFNFDTPTNFVIDAGTRIKLGSASANQPTFLADKTLSYLEPILNSLILLSNALLLTPYPQVQLYAQELSLKIADFKANVASMKSKKVRVE